MISDVPGYTWGTVTAMAHAGIRYFSTAPNYFDRIGTILREWENKPFYWVGPDGQSKVLVWIPFWGYAMSHQYGKMSPRLVEDFSDGLEKRSYPFDIAYVRWSGHGDNAVPDPAICEFVRDWNAKYAWPHFIISGTSEAFRAFEQRYGDRLPLVRGDWTPYWEDGAGSSALETAMNRASSDRLAQAETLFAMLKPSAYPAAAFEDAWNKVLLYSEHTWGAECSVSRAGKPEDPRAVGDQDRATPRRRTSSRASCWPRHWTAERDRIASAPLEAAVDVFNTLSWPRTELVTLSKELSAAGDRVIDDKGKAVPSQRLSSGELVFLAKDVPPFAAQSLHRDLGRTSEAKGRAAAQGTTLDNGVIRLRVDEKTGGIVELTAKGIEGNFADTSGGEALNDYLYLPGDDLKDLQRNGPVTIRVGEKGPLVASLIVESAAPGCKKLVRELRVVAGLRLRRDHQHGGQGAAAGEELPCERRQGERELRVPLRRAGWRHAPRPSAGRDASGGRPDAQRLQELVHRGPLGRCLEQEPRRHVGDARCAAGAGGRPHRHAAQLADRPERLAQARRADAEALLVGHEQPLGHQLPRLPGRPDRVPLHPAAARPARRRGGVALRHRLQPAACWLFAHEARSPPARRC